MKSYNVFHSTCCEIHLCSCCSSSSFSLWLYSILLCINTPQFVYSMVDGWLFSFQFGVTVISAVMNISMHLSTYFCQTHPGKLVIRMQSWTFIDSQWKLSTVVYQLFLPVMRKFHLYTLNKKMALFSQIDHFVRCVMTSYGLAFFS